MPDLASGYPRRPRRAGAELLTGVDVALGPGTCRAAVQSGLRVQNTTLTDGQSDFGSTDAAVPVTAAAHSPAWRQGRPVSPDFPATPWGEPARWPRTAAGSLVEDLGDPVPDVTPR